MAKTTDQLLKSLAPGEQRADMSRLKGYLDSAIIYLASGYPQSAKRELQYLHQFATCVDGVEFRSPYAEYEEEE